MRNAQTTAHVCKPAQSKHVTTILFTANSIICAVKMLV